MSTVDLHNLIQRLTPESVLSLESAAAIAVRTAQDTVELTHWLAGAVDRPEFAGLFERADISIDRLRAELQQELAAARPGSGGAPGLAQTLVNLVKEAWVCASLTYGRQRIAPADLLLTLLDDSVLRSLACSVAPSLRRANRSAIEAIAASLSLGRENDARSGVPTGSAPAAGGEDFLRLYTQDMTEMAASGRLDPVIGRDNELRQVIDILLRRRQNNPILVGEAGVGKTAVAEALALRIAANEIPDKLKGVRLLSLDLSLLQAGAGVKGEFERRLRGVVDAVKASEHPIILFIDEAHGLIGAGNQPGQGDAANILKPPLARGELRTVGATTWSEYKRHIEKDPALTRRFQPVNVIEPNEEAAVRMLRGVAQHLETHHGVPIRDEALRSAVRLSARYIPARQLPDKAISLIDTAAASVAFGRQSEPAELADLRQERAMLALEVERLAGEPTNETTTTRLTEIEARLGGLNRQIVGLVDRLTAERELVAEADGLEDKLTREPTPEVRAALADCDRRLAALQGKAALVHRVVDADSIAALVARWTGIPVGRLVSDEIDALNGLAARLKARVVGQDAALDTLAAAMRVSRAGLSDPRRPPGVFLMVGMSGIGKTETALALADELYGGPQNLTTISMSEFKEEHKVSMLVGSPPGYVGFGEGGVLTEAVRRRPYGVLLLDEMDKAHPGVQDVFYQLFDKGSLRDGEGRDIDFKNTTILMTANTGSEVLAALAADPDTMPDSEALLPLLKEPLLAQFKPAFLGRITVLPYLPLDGAAMEGIVEIQVNKVRERVAGSYGARLSISPAARKALVDAAINGDAGARAIEARISREILPLLSTHFLAAIPAGTTKQPVDIDFDAGCFFIRGHDETSKLAPDSVATPDTGLADTDASPPQAGPRDPATPDRASEPERLAV